MKRGWQLVKRLRLGEGPRVVGTILTPEYLEQWRARPHLFPCDLVELRVDGYSEWLHWLTIGKSIEQSGTPVLATIRHSREGGLWHGEETARQGLLESALLPCSAIDIELHCEIAAPLAHYAEEQDKACILSFHDFQKTPPRAELLAILERMQELGTISKIATTANSPEDVETLRSLLREPWEKPVCIIGMGSHGRETRLAFPREGSCLTYGYLDIPGAPGQYSAQELTDHLAGGR